MKTLKNWAKFNEMKGSTYKSAADKAQEYGNKELANKFREHPKFLRELEDKKRAEQQSIRNAEMVSKYSSVEPFNFKVVGPKGQVQTFTGKFMGTEPGMEFDMFCDNDKEGISIAPHFLMKGKKPIGEEETEYVFSPFWISYYPENANYKNGEIFIDGPYNIDESPWAKYKENPGAFMSEGDGNYFPKFTSRKDANRFLDLLKNSKILKQQYDEFYEQYYKNREEDWKEFMDCKDDVLSNLNVRQLYIS
jgi:hypothetical protein